MSQHTSATISTRRTLLSKLLWFLEEFDHPVCGAAELRRFFAYLNTGHSKAGGRWGNGCLTEPLRPTTVRNYHKHLRVFFKWLVTEETLTVSPMEKIPVPLAREDQVQPFTQEQIQALLRAAKHSRHRRRDEALVVFLYDTGLRATEVCNLRFKYVDLDERRCRILGKGNKYRIVPFGRETKKVLWQYLRDESRELDEPLFLSDRGTSAGNALTRSGLRQLIERLGQSAGIQATRCSPHTFRHTFAIDFLRRGGNTFTLKTILGHTSLHMTNKYVTLAQADIERQHAQFSPADWLAKNR